ncbi:hypothetical protein JCM10213v2_001148 [Rhodosporidiobolus nylandii]
MAPSTVGGALAANAAEAAPVIAPQDAEDVDVQQLDDMRSTRATGEAGSDKLSETETAVSKEAQGVKDKDGQVHVIPKNKMLPVMFGLTLTTFLPALDQTCVSTALSTMSRDLHGSNAALSWVSGAYLLCVTSLAPCYGKLSDYFGRKIVLFSSILVFMLGSALCGCAKSMVWLCAARGVQGLGGGGVMQMTQIIVSDITPLATRGKYTSIIGATWGLAAVLGPLIGGALTSSNATWRWIFYINLPAAGLAIVVLFFFLNLNPHSPPRLAELLATFDFLGLFLLVAGLATLLVGFSLGESDWSAPATIACLVVGPVVLLAAIANELTTKRSPIIPPRIFRIRSAAGILIGVFFQGFAFISLSFYEPLYFQALGSSPLMSGVELMPFSVGTAIIGVISGFVVAKTKRVREQIWASFAISVLGFALLATLNEKSNRAQQELYLLVAGIGIGPLFQLPFILIQSAMPVSLMATSTATVALMRSIGGTVGISVCGAIYASQLRKHLAGVAGYMPSGQGGAVGEVEGLTDIAPAELRQQVLRAYTRALSYPWIVATPLLFVGFLASLMIKHYSLDRSTVKAADAKKDEVQAEGELEKAAEGEREKAAEAVV